jgi:hypothetical protein
MFALWGEVICVVCSINAIYSPYANLKYMVKIDFIKIKLKYNKIRMTIIGIEDYQIK